MQQGVRGHPIVIRTALGNKRISRKRSYDEHPFTVLYLRSLLLLPLWRCLFGYRWRWSLHYSALTRIMCWFWENRQAPCIRAFSFAKIRYIDEKTGVMNSSFSTIGDPYCSGLSLYSLVRTFLNLRPHTAIIRLYISQYFCLSIPIESYCRILIVQSL
jgi:hypothetical protein